MPRKAVQRVMGAPAAPQPPHPREAATPAEVCTGAQAIQLRLSTPVIYLCIDILLIVLVD